MKIKDCLFEKINLLADFFWALKFFFRGKIIRQKEFVPQKNFPCSEDATIRRIKIIMFFWVCYNKKKIF